MMVTSQGGQAPLIYDVLHITSYLKIAKSENEVSYPKLFIIKILSDVFTTANLENKNFDTLVIQNLPDLSGEIMENICRFLITICRTGELLQICYALDAFYEIFSEGFYDDVLKSQQVIEQMKQGNQSLQMLYKKVRKEFSPAELCIVENALENVVPFINYKT